MRRSDKIILGKIITAIDVGLKVFKDAELEFFLESDSLKLSMAMTIIRIGELVKNLSPEIRNENSHIAWKDIAGFRDVAAHKYDTLIMSDVYATAKNDFPQLKMQIEKILEVDD